MAICVILDENGVYQNTIMCELNDPIPTGWQMLEVPEGSLWDGTKVVTQQEYIDTLRNVKTPEVF